VRRSTQLLRIVVTGLIAQHPTLGGVAWDYLQYALGLRQLGHDVYYFEDSGEWPYTLDGGPSGRDWVAHDCAANVKHLAAVMERVGLGDRWAYRFPIKPRWFGMPHAHRREVLQTADLLINVSGSLERPAEYRSVRRLAYIDSDPVFTQVKLALRRGHLKFHDRVDQHDVHFSFGERLSAGVPETPYRWLPTRQPIVMSEWRPKADHREVYTTVMSWTSYKPLRYGGRVYAQKDSEFLRFLALPGQVAPTRLEVAVNGTQHRKWQSDSLDETAGQLLARRGWGVADPLVVGASLDAYRTYLESSKGEWSVAKHGYVMGQPGWFSCRSACYLAAGRPVIVQNTGFDGVLPTGEGIVPFSTPDEAANAIREVDADYPRHARAAREIAEAFFGSEAVLSRLVERAA
jgi:hypothetical protein